jgi:ribosome biogenesis GTPase / thiamine phosphate phosphatase
VDHRSSKTPPRAAAEHRVAKGGGRKVRVDFRQNRAQPKRESDWTRRYHGDDEDLADARSGETVRAKGALSRKRTIRVGADEAPLVDESQWQPGLVVTIRGPICEVQDAGGRTWDCTLRRVLKSMLIQQRSAIAVGDRVWYAELPQEPGIAVIERVEPRESVLARGSRVGHDERRSGHLRQHVIAANVDQVLIVASAAQPAFKPHLVDRFLVAAAQASIRPILCINKCDLAFDEVELPEDEHEPSDRAVEYVTLDELLKEYADIGYSAIKASATRGDGIEALAAELRGKITVLSGQSGVGKSSLLNVVSPGLNLTTGEVSEVNEKGRHTTTHARLLRLSCGGYVVDTPGIRSFDLWDVQPGGLEACFAEFAELIPQCRFNDCHHVGELGCAVRAAAEEGRISERRYWSYRKMLHELSRKR